MRKIAFYCDICDAEKRSVNRWWLVFINDKGLQMCEWDDAKAKRKGAKHLCGVEHLYKMVGQYVDGGAKVVPLKTVANIELLRYSEGAQG